MLKQATSELLDQGYLQAATLRGAVESLMQGSFGEAEAAAFLTALRLRGETAEHLAAAASVLHGHMVKLNTGNLAVLDTCGTGGDGTRTFNISTAVALTVAACGVPVVKHGNRSVSSSSGSADVLEALGVRIDGEPPIAERCLREVGLAFCFAPKFHPAMRHVAELRRRLGFRTIFNLLGPLLNPARAAYQLIGVGHAALLDPLAHALLLLGGVKAILVHGQDGLDEVTLGGATAMRLVADGEVRAGTWTPESFALPRCSKADLQVRSVEQSAERVRQVLRAQSGPATNVVLANAAVALLTVGRVACLPDGVRLARTALATGKAQERLQRLIEVSHQN